jgi:hypothetical protein
MSTSIYPIVTCEDVRQVLNGTYSGSSYVFWNVPLSSGSVLAQINMANYYLTGVLGQDKMAATDDVTFYHLRAAELDYSCMRVLTLLSGDVIVDGFSITAGITIQQPLLLATYRNLIAEFKEAAQLHLRAIQPLSVSAESNEPTYRDTAPSYY